MKNSTKTLTISSTLSRWSGLLSTSLVLALMLTSCSSELTTSPDFSDNSLQLKQSSKMISSVSEYDLGAASAFAVLGGTGDVTLTDSHVTGDVGHFPGTSDVIMTNSTVDGTVNADAEQAHYDFLDAYDAFEALDCGTTLTGTLDNVTLAQGVYCFDAAATLTGTLTLDGQGDSNASWTFKIGTSGTGALTGTNFSVEMANDGEACSVNWWVAQAATMTTSNLKGNVLAGEAITFTGAGSFTGRALSKADVTLTGMEPFGTCEIGSDGSIPQNEALKVTGGGQIAVNGGSATFGFNADRKNGNTKGHLNYVNHVTGLHINGQVDQVSIISLINGIKTVQFSGTSVNKGKDSQSTEFVVTVEDHGEPGNNDMFGITISGDASETTGKDVISRGNIKFHM